MFHFPRTVCFQAVRGQDQGRLQQFARHDSGEMRVPSMAMNHVGLRRGLRHFDISAHVMEHLDVWIAVVHHFGQARIDSFDVHTFGIDGLLAKTSHFDLGQLGQFLAQKINVYTCATVNMRWEFIGKKCYFHLYVFLID